LARARRRYTVDRATGRYGMQDRTKMVRPDELCSLAEACIGFNQFDKASAALDEALTIAESDGDRYCEAETRRLRGELLLRKSESDQVEAETCFKRATEVAGSKARDGGSSARR